MVAVTMTMRPAPPIPTGTTFLPFGRRGAGPAHGAWSAVHLVASWPCGRMRPSPRRFTLEVALPFKNSPPAGRATAWPPQSVSLVPRPRDGRPGNIFIIASVTAPGAVVVTNRLARARPTRCGCRAGGLCRTGSRCKRVRSEPQCDDDFLLNPSSVEPPSIVLARSKQVAGRPRAARRREWLTVQSRARQSALGAVGE